MVGRKIGLTSKAVQKQLGVHQPDYGMLFADMARCDGEEISIRDVMQPKVEAEIAFVLGRDLTEEQLTVADLQRAIEFALPAIEIVGSRIKNWDIKITDTIADNASSGLYVLGSRPCQARQLRAATGRHGDGEERRAGLGWRRRGLHGQPAQCGALARSGDGAHGKPLEGRRHHSFRRLGTDGCG